MPKTFYAKVVIRSIDYTLTVRYNGFHPVAMPM